MNLTVLTFIALWCGQPVNSTKGAMGFKSGTDVSSYQVSECRKQMIACAKTMPSASTISETCLDKSPIH
jgi:hypothetical protein